MDNRELALNNPRTELLNKVRRSERSLNTFIQRVAASKNVEKTLPQTHKFFASLNNYRSVRGALTDNQKVAINREIDKYADQFLVLMSYSQPKLVEDATVSDYDDSHEEFDHGTGE